jgi:hypothetical protein
MTDTEDHVVDEPTEAPAPPVTYIMSYEVLAEDPEVMHTENLNVFFRAHENKNLKIDSLPMVTSLTKAGPSSVTEKAVDA